MSDYISRKAAIKELLDTYEREFPTAYGAFDLFAERIMPRVLRNIPAADVELVRHGRWKRYSTTMMECSLCGKHTARHKFNYCPNCGAKMGLEGENNDN